MTSSFSSFAGARIPSRIAARTFPRDVRRSAANRFISGETMRMPPAAPELENRTVSATAQTVASAVRVEIHIAEVADSLSSALKLID